MLTRFARTKTLATISMYGLQRLVTPIATMQTRCFSTEETVKKQEIQLPFLIERTKSNNLPVYVTHHHQGSLVVTHIRKYIGDAEALERAVQAVVGPDRMVRRRPGRIEIKGDVRQELEDWILAIGY